MKQTGSPTRPLRGEKGSRLDLFLKKNLKQYSRTRLQGWIEKGYVRVNGEEAKASLRLRGGELIELNPPSPRTDIITPRDIPLKVIYEDDDLLVVDKPPGLLVHPLRPGGEATLVNALLDHASALSSLGPADRPGIVHRLDRDTSGLLLVAKTNRAHLALAQQFRKRSLYKEYRALAYHRPPEDRGEISLPLGRQPARRTLMAVKFLGGRAARTDYEVPEELGGASYLRLVIHSGRTHQIRVHLSYLGSPVLGDRYYGRAGRDLAAELEVPRQMLHAYRLKLQHPTREKALSLTAPLPADFRKILAKLRKARRN